MKVLITGANGFLGRHVVAAFLKRGHAVRALVRPASNLEKLNWGETVEIFRADLRAARNLVDAFDGIDAIVHLAAGVTGDEDSQFAHTVVGTERLLEAMAKSQTKRITLASSFSVYDWARIKGELDETAPLEGDANPQSLYERDGYAVAKVWQERIVSRAAIAKGWELTVLRPGFIWGKGNEYLAGIGQKIGPVHLVIGLGSKLPLTHVENCADAFAVATENPKAVGQTFNVVDSDGISTWQYTGEYLRGSHERGIRVPFPYTLGMIAARGARVSSKFIFRGKGKLPSILVPTRFRARFKPVKCSNRKLRDTLGWQPPLDYQASLNQTYTVSE